MNPQTPSEWFDFIAGVTIAFILAESFMTFMRWCFKRKS